MTDVLQMPPSRAASDKHMLSIRSGKDIARIHGLARELGSSLAFSRSELERLANAAARMASLIRRSSKRGAMTVEIVFKDGTPGISMVAQFGLDDAGPEILTSIQCDHIEQPWQVMAELSRSFDSFDFSPSDGPVFRLTKWARRETNYQAMAS